ncbi:Hint domain-containing protein [Celeribacter arenosi]|uniref:Hedgehog/Intein (Hint) domain-containing protein n=1 Tax=Celeribacter arenosi TaxID=792649 RepID=A0ABP7KA61_9RHOB
MAFIWIYSPSDFVGGLPSEYNAAAAGRVPFTLTLKAGAEPVKVQINDDDEFLDEVDYSQSLLETTTIGTRTYAAGTTIHSAYDLLNTTTDLKVTSIHFGGDGYQQGPVQGLVANQPLLEGQSYTFNVERTSNLQYDQYNEYVACFCAGTEIVTNKGAVPIEDLSVGAMVWTVDHGFQAIRWIGSTTVNATGGFAPICIEPGVLGNDKLLKVSPEHRLLFSGTDADILFHSSEVLVAAKHLVDGDRIRREEGGSVTYFHMLFDDHEIVMSNGTLSESFHPSTLALGGLDQSTREELIALFPELATQGKSAPTPTARPCLKRHEAELLKSHLKSLKIA